MSKRPNVEEALKRVSSRYELVHASAKRVKQLLERGEDIFIRDRARGELIKKTFQAIEDIAQGKVQVVRLRKRSEGG
ncbi:MAG: DNA-directed RNA polymerase subunit omega [Aquificaceae bacterium]|nr:DNA-directed RNA polymerase subunit omega [Aquificaceae bacterium]MCS7196761.1 DNA-directed RNA polymerase subunit omega [Aquificaceae bacterium]MCX7989977.1 DNA-directed RNA polymerase subunit omega [Aquificaceae bacterium]MDW8033033.1 DNA-directed RNA polymerase subunit omega [Aquificaceae bacterium]MDW8294532.1 DNA-directed RNA polymerase subunit omega [Aquificaceae bacterium]